MTWMSEKEISWKSTQWLLRYFTNFDLLTLSCCQGISRDFLWETWISVPNFTAIYLIFLDISQPYWQTIWPTNIAIPRATQLVWLKTLSRNNGASCKNIFVMSFSFFIQIFKVHQNLLTGQSHHKLLVLVQWILSMHEEEIYEEKYEKIGERCKFSHHLSVPLKISVCMSSSCMRCNVLVSLANPQTLLSTISSVESCANINCPGVRRRLFSVRYVFIKIFKWHFF